MHNTHTTPMHTPNMHHQNPLISVDPDEPYHIISTEPVTIPARTNTIRTLSLALLCFRNYLFEPSKQYFVDQPVQYTPEIINVENDNLPVHFINHNDHEVVIPMDSYVGAMEKVQESKQDISHANTSPEPVTQHALSECFAQSDLLPDQRQCLYHVLQENSGVFRSSTADLTSIPLDKHYIDTGHVKLIKQRAYRASNHHCKDTEKQVQEMLQNGIIEPSVSPWASLSWSEKRSNLAPPYRLTKPQ